jgi:acetyl-CoA C-acetyltransferase
VRLGKRMGNGKLIDGLLKDGLTNPFNDTLMGVAAEKCAEIYKISREEQDDYTLLSFKRAYLNCF